MELTVGTLVDGKVKSITKFGAFLYLPDNRVGLVHISEISNDYVSDVRQYLQEGQTVRVKVIGIDAAGKISLSIRRAQEPAAPRPAAKPPKDAAPKEPQTFEEKLRRFMSDSDRKISGCRQYEHRSRSRRR